MAGLHAAGCRAAHQPHLRLSVGEEAAVPGIIHAVWPFVTWFTENIFREDKEIVEYEQRAYDAQGADWNNEVFPPIRDLRSVLGPLRRADE